jgi:hypothetical protein
LRTGSDLKIHIADVVNVMKWESFSNVMVGMPERLREILLEVAQ